MFVTRTHHNSTLLAVEPYRNNHVKCTLHRTPPGEKRSTELVGQHYALATYLADDSFQVLKFSANLFSLPAIVIVKYWIAKQFIAKLNEELRSS